ncbi:MAG: molybdopterin-dependent oxidoreductase [Rhodocyclaceae bacterium]
MKRETKSTCCYCGTGCGVIIESEGDRVVGVRGDPEHPANFGMLCSKGASLHLTARHPTRLLYPEMRESRDAARQRVSWDDALDSAARRFAETIRAHGPDSVAFYISGQLLTEDYYVFNKLAKGLIGTNNVDTNSRLCMSSAVAGYKQTLGADSVPCSYEDIAAAGCILIAGANPAVAHPIVFRRIEQAKAANPQLKIIVIDPRRSESAALADLHLALKPGTDIALFNALLHVMIDEALIDRAYIDAHTEGFAALAQAVEAYSPAAAAAICGVAAESIVQAARWFAQADGALSFYCQGLNQSSHGTHNNAALIHLHLATAQIGKPGAGPFSLTGQPNAMGGREVGGLSNLLSAHRDLANPAHRAEMARFWGVPFVAQRPGKAAIDLFRALKTGEVKAVWIACTNPAHSLPEQAEVRAALRAAEFVVLQENYGDTDTAAFADLLLPATGWSEKDGTVTNSERRITRVRSAVAKPGETRHDWEIAVDFARRLGAELGQPLTGSLFPYGCAEAIFNEHRASTHGRDLDITGLSYELLETQGPQQWPYPEGASAGRVRLYGDGLFPTANGRARFVAVEHRPLADEPDAARPISLLSGRSRDQWHGMSRSGTVPRLFNASDEPVVEMNSCDMRHRGLEDGDLVRVHNARGSIVVPALAGAGMARGLAWLPMHWGSRFMNSPGANALTPSAVDPYSFQPELKHAAVAVDAAKLPWPLVVIRRVENTLPEGASLDAATLLARARTLLPEFEYASVAFNGRAAALMIFRAASATPLPEARLQEIDALFGLDDEAEAIVFVDARRNISKRALTRDGQMIGVRLAGDARAQGWIKQAIAEAQAGSGAGTGLARWAVAPLSAPPLALPTRSRVVCQCADVSEQQIGTLLAQGHTLEAVQATLKCGTYCGGCLPELRRMAARTALSGDPQS